MAQVPRRRKSPPLHSLRSGGLGIISLSLVVAILSLCSSASNFVASSAGNVSKPAVSTSSVMGMSKPSAAHASGKRVTEGQGPSALPACCLAAAALAAALHRATSKRGASPPKVIVSAALPSTTSFAGVTAPKAAAYPSSSTMPDLISLDAEGFVPTVVCAAASKDLMEVLPEPCVLISEDLPANMAGATVPNFQSKHHQRGRTGRNKAEGRRERRRVGARLMSSKNTAEPFKASYDPSKVPSRIQRGLSLGPFPTCASGREVKSHSEAQGAQVLLDVGGLQSFELNDYIWMLCLHTIRRLLSFSHMDSLTLSAKVEN
eukprot:TRINITY_DN4226_c1_g4_i1.p1 TRINITY_DN4226_c1_g4~~TRINITY_DN4226_c1_g4_i1.p1  ORF type:complete len:318 (-),score=53.46 TRINITY_DN4226_c1_g4_i1:192-1145(-)